jgi:hypothetical protein
MMEKFPEADLKGYQTLVDAMPNPKDRQIHRQIRREPCVL